MKIRWLYSIFGVPLVVLLLGAFGISLQAGSETANPQAPNTKHDLGRGVNFGNALEAPSEGLWGLTLKSAYFEVVKRAGFDTVRLPVSWTHHAATTSPYAIDPDFFRRVDWAVDEALKRGLNIIINMHHYDALNSNPREEGGRYLALWRQIAERYKHENALVYFELLNEPHEQFNREPELWNDLLAKAVEVVRESNPTRPLIIGPVGWNTTSRLDELALPDDSNLIATIHFYEPFEFTHQGAAWVTTPPPAGVSWTGEERMLVWDDWSWDTRVRWRASEGDQPALMLTFEKPWAGFKLHPAKPEEGYDTLHLRANGALELLIGCEHGLQTIVTRVGWHDYLVDLSTCEEIGNLVIQNASDQAPASIYIQTLELRGRNGELPLIMTSKDVLRETLDRAAGWAAARDIPLLLGEFGAYSVADMSSRVRWTRFVREEAERRGFAWAYWEFGAGYGVYSPETDQWRTRLLEALLPRLTR